MKGESEDHIVPVSTFKWCYYLPFTAALQAFEKLDYYTVWTQNCCGP